MSDGTLIVMMVILVLGCLAIMFVNVIQPLWSRFQKWRAHRAYLAEKFSDPNVIDLSKGCPDCGCRRYFEGPAGGACINVMCADCQQWFNLCTFDGTAERLNAKGPNKEPCTQQNS